MYQISFIDKLDQWSQWVKLADCLQEKEKVITPYKRTCIDHNGRERSGYCDGEDTKEEICDQFILAPFTISARSKAIGTVFFKYITIKGTVVTSYNLHTTLSHHGILYTVFKKDTRKALLSYHIKHNKFISDIEIINMTMATSNIQVLYFILLQSNQQKLDELNPKVNITNVFESDSVFTAGVTQQDLFIKGLLIITWELLFFN